MKILQLLITMKMMTPAPSGYSISSWKRFGGCIDCKVPKTLSTSPYLKSQLLWQLVLVLVQSLSLHNVLYKDNVDMHDNNCL